jgi:hypothetical protein
MSHVDVHQYLKNVLQGQEPVSKYVSEEERKEFMKWLSEVDYRGDHEANLRNILENSGEWMLHHEKKFDDWKDKGTVLWLCGIRQ